MKLVWIPRFTRAVKRFAKTRPRLLDDLEQTLRLLESAPHHPSLRTHKLKGDLKDCWACSAGYDFRLIFEFQKNPKTREPEIHLLNIGTHDEVY
jgi:addiction module RelE/StbE family toxin